MTNQNEIITGAKEALEILDKIQYQAEWEWDRKDCDVIRKALAAKSISKDTNSDEKSIIKDTELCEAIEYFDEIWNKTVGTRFPSTAIAVNTLIQAAKAYSEMGWRPIETVLHGGHRAFLVANLDKGYLEPVHSMFGKYKNPWSNKEIEWSPTHWSPLLPLPPKPKEE